ncbi:MAG: hypothetical protein EOP84_13140 [Verrucomicrobiaceae bacterium]|nr:MAG: hypothetical protein EOP84_13140 [Verrucomicrobiaceae bacterium]
MAFVVLCSNRRNATIALLATALIVPLGQQILVMGLHFRFARILILIGVLRVLLRGEARTLRLTKVDRLFIGWALVTLSCGIFRGPKAETFGMAYDALGAYFLFRVWVGNLQHLQGHLRTLTGLLMIMAVCMAIELATQRNLFFMFGGVPEISAVRDGRLRCQGPFRHPILAGTFAAAMFPLVVGLWFGARRDRPRAVAGMVSSILCTYAAASSGALLTLLGAIVGFCLWPMRSKMHLIRRGIVASIMIMAILMTPPVWFIIGRISEITGGTGWHRSHLIDQAITHIGEWWLIGTSYTAHWASDPYTILAVDPNNMDITNHYVAQATTGGALGLGLFLLMLATCYRTIGRAVRAGKNRRLHPKVAWALGVSLFANCVAFISVSYFDQIQIYWFWLLAVISALSLAGPRLTGAKQKTENLGVQTADTCPVTA